MDAVIAVAADGVTVGATAADVPSGRNVVLNAVQNPNSQPRSLVPNNRPVAMSEVGDEKSLRAKSTVGVTSAGPARIVPLAASAPVVAMKKAGDVAGTSDRNRNVSRRARHLRRQRRKKIPSAKVSGKPLLRRQRASTIPR